MNFRKVGQRLGLFALPLLLLVSVTSGCGDSRNDYVFNPITNPVITPTPDAQTGTLAIELELVNGRALSPIFATIRVRLIQDQEIVVERDFLRAETGSEQTLTIPNLLPGDYQLQLVFLDEDDEALGRFESTVTIKAGEVTVVDDPDFTPLTFLSSRSRTVDLPLNSVPMTVTAGDFNEDGITDFAAAGHESDEVYILLGRADGSYEEPAVLNGIASAREIIDADLDDDGHLDLVVANWGTGVLSIFYGNGDGTFEVVTPLNLGGAAHSVKAVDLNGDGHLDLAVANTMSEQIDILLGDGDRNFVAHSNVEANSWVVRVVVAELNGDDDLDLAFVDREDGTISVALGNGDGTFEAATTFSAATTRPFNLAVGDVDGDGDLDLVPSGRDNSVLPVFINNGAGGFTQKGTVQTGTDIIWVELADVNGDGVLDLLASALQDSAIYTSIGNGDGSFSTASGATLNAATGPFSFLVEDIDGDALLDVVTVNRGSFGNLGTAAGPASLSIFYGE